MADERIDIDVNARDNASGPLSRARFSLDDLGDTAVGASGKLDAAGRSIDDVGDEAKGMSAMAKLAERRLKRMGNAALGAAAKLRVASAAASNFGRNIATIGGGGGGSPGRGRPGRGGYNFGGFLKLMLKFRALRLAALFTLIASVIPAVVAAIGGLAAGAVALVGALAPLTGLIVAYPGYLAAFGQAFAAIKLAFSGMGEAIEAFGDITKTGQEVNQAINAFAGVGARSQVKDLLEVFGQLRGEFNVIKGAVQVALLPAVSELGRAFGGLMPLIGGALQQTGFVMADVIRQFTSVLDSPEMSGKLGQIMGNNLSILSSFGRAGVSAFQALVDILVAAGPMLNQIARDIESFFSGFADNVSGGGLTDFFTDTYGVLRQVMDMLTNFGAAIKNIMGIGRPLGDAILGSWQTAAQNFRDFTESGEGIQKITDWFVEMTPVIYEIGYLLRDLFFGLVEVGNADSFLMLSEQIRMEMIPALVDFIDHAKDLLPPILEIVTEVINLAAAFSGLGGFRFLLETLATLFDGIATVVGFLVNGPLRIVFELMAKIFAMYVLGKLMVAAWMGIKVAIEFVKNAAIGATAAIRALKTALITTGIGAVLVGISFLIEGIFNLNSGVESQIEENKLWAQSLFDVSGAMTETSAHAVAMRLANEGLFDVANKAGISNQELVSTLMQGGEAVEELLSTLRKLYQLEGPDTFKWERDWFGNPSKNFVSDQAREAYTAVSQLERALPPLAGGIALAGDAAAAAAPFYPKMADGMDEVAESTSRATEAIQEFMQLLDMFDTRASWRRSLMELQSGIEESLEDGVAQGMFKKWTDEGEQNLANLRDTFQQTMGIVNGYLEAGNEPAALKMINNQIKQIKRIMELVPKDMQGPFQTLLSELRGVRDEIEGKYKAEVEVEAQINAKPVQGYFGSGDLYKQPAVAYFGSGDLYAQAVAPVSEAKTVVDELGTSLDTLSAKTTDVKINYTSVGNALMSVRNLTDALNALDGKIITITVKTVRTTGNARDGGPIWGGGDYRVGERGPEMFISAATGAARMIGTSGQQLRRFSEDGYVIPNHMLPGSDGVKRSAASAVAAMRQPQVRGSVEAVGATVNIGTIVAKSEVDVVKAVRKGIAQAERDRQERS